MNTFKRKCLFAAALLGVALLAGCASQGDYYGAVKAQLEAQSRENVARFEADAARWKAVAAIAPKLDASGAAAATGIAFAQGAGPGAISQPASALAIQPPKSGLEHAWTAALQVADVALRAYGIKVGGDVAITQSNNQAQTAIASYGAFSTMGGQIRDAGVAGYPFVQAPAANLTLSGTGVIGAGSYVGPVTTTRNCNGGTGAAGGAGGAGGGTTTGAQGGNAGTGGGATGGSC